MLSNEEVKAIVTEKAVEVEKLDLKEGDILVVKLGADAQDIGCDEAWIPKQQDIEITQEIYERVIEKAGYKNVHAVVFHKWIDFTVLRNKSESG